ncbi:MAG: thiamine pyrophosphate-dependent enzyme, partial [Lysobacterales bacterium]
VVDHTPVSESVVVGTTGYTGRELFAVADRPNHLYLVGSMGCASSFALGLSLALPGKRVVVLDGDGAALMRMGNFATAGAYAGDNFFHVVLDNSAHESTGGQSTVSASTSFAAVAAACGYADAREEVRREALESFMQQARGPALMHLRIRGGVPAELPRPGLSPVEVRQRLMRHLGISTSWFVA